MENMQILMEKLQEQIISQNWKHVESLFANQEERLKLILDTIKESHIYRQYNYSGRLYDIVIKQLLDKHPDDYMDHYMDYISKLKQYLYVDEWQYVFNLFLDIYTICEMNYFKKESTPIEQIKDSRVLQKEIKQAKDVLDVVIYFKMKLYCIYNKEIISQNKIVSSIQIL